MATTLIPPARQLVLGAAAEVDGFHPAVGTWFRRRFPEGPTEPQRDAWPHIAAGSDTLDRGADRLGQDARRLPRSASTGCTSRTTPASRSTASRRVVYVSPLKALAVDIAENLERPLREIAEVAGELGLDRARHRVAVRTGDTPSAERARMMRKPPSFFVTTPESLYLLVTSASGRRRAAHGRDGDRRRDPRGRARQARLAPRAHARAARSVVRDAPDPGRPLGDAAPDRDGRPAARR